MPDVEKAWAFLRNSDPVSSAEEVQAAIRRVATEIEDQLAASYPLVLAVMGGAVGFAGRILALLRFPLHFDYFHAPRYGTATARGGIRSQGGEPPSDCGRGSAVRRGVPSPGGPQRSAHAVGQACRRARVRLHPRLRLGIPGAPRRRPQHRAA